MPTLADIARTLQLPPPPDADRKLSGIANLADAGPSDLSLLGSDVYFKAFAASKAMAVIVTKRLHIPSRGDKVIFEVEDAELAVGQVLPLFAPPVQQPAPGIDQA